MENWKDIIGFEGLYQVSDKARVRNRFGRIIAQEIVKGYQRVHLWKFGKGKHYSVHRLVAIAFIPNPNNLPMINHKDENPSNNYVHINADGTVDMEKSNLEWCDAKYNRNYGTCNERIIAAQKGRKLTEEHKKNISEALKNSEIFHNLVKSDEYRQKLKDAQKDKPQLNRKDLSEPIDQIDIKTGEILVSYPSAKEAARQLGVGQCNISRCANGGFYWNGKWLNVSKAYGFIWKKVQAQP